MGRKTLISLLGVEKYNKVSRIVHQSVFQTCTAVVLFDEMVFFNIIPKFGAAIVLTSICEMGVNVYRYMNEEISGKEWLRLSGKIIARNVTAFYGVAVGMKLGAAIGTAICPGIGTISGIIAGVIFGFIAGKTTEKLYEEWFPDVDEQNRKKMLKEALAYFNYLPDDICNTSMLNVAELNRRRRRRALESHPDRNGGNNTKWATLSMHYGVLLALVHKNAVDKKIVFKAIKI